VPQRSVESWFYWNAFLCDCILHVRVCYTSRPIAYSIHLLALKIGRDTMSRLVKPTKENYIGGGLFGIALTLVGATLHKWSWAAIVANLLETFFLPWIIVFCLLFSWYLFRATRDVYRQESISFANALGGVTKTPPWHFRWRCYLIAAIYLFIPVTCAYLALEKSQIWSEISQASELPDPIIHIEPEVGRIPALDGHDAVFSIQTYNGGVDVDHLEVAKDYFMTLHDNGILKIAKLAGAVRAPVLDSDLVPLRANQTALVPADFNQMQRWMADNLRKSDYVGYVGVRLRMYYRRYSDQKDYGITKVFFVSGDYKSLIALEESGVRSLGPGPTVLSGPELTELLSHIKSDQDWVSPTFEQSFPGGKMTVLFEPIR
jgi:hypothetical protein